MRINHIFFHLLYLLTISISCGAQIKNVGIPNIVNHNRSKYNASTQNWSITQTANGFMYFGNNDGTLEYDGTSWKTHIVPNRSVVRSVLAIGDTVYTGAFEEIGFLAPNHNGELQYNSLNHLIPESYKNFDEIWNIYENNGRIFFQSFNYIFILSSGKINVIKPLSKFSMLHKANGTFYIVDAENGLMRVENDSLILTSNHPIFFRNEIRCIISLDEGSLLIGTSNEGIFLFEEKGSIIKPWKSDVNSEIKRNNLFSAIKLSSGNLALGSISNGIYICNQNGQILQHLNRYKGLQNNTILSLFEDKKNNLWLGLDNGIDYLEVSSPLSFLNYNYSIESAYSTIVYNGIMYVGTNQGLYAKKFSEVNNYNPRNGEFQLIKGTEGQVWTLEIVDNTLFCGHNFGCFIIDGYSAKQISDVRGFWSFIKPLNNKNIILAGTYTGLVRLTNINGEWKFFDSVKGFEESSRIMHFDRTGNLWISHGYRGIFKLKLSDSFDSVLNAHLYQSANGLPDRLPYNIQVINSALYITTRSGILSYNASNDTFEKSEELNKIFEGKSFIDKIHQDQSGNLWYFTDTYLGIMRLLEDGSYIDITSPFSEVNDILLPAFQNIYIHDQHNVLVGSQKGLIHYSPAIVKDYLVADDVYIKEATFYGRLNNQVNFFTATGENFPSGQLRIIPYTHNSVTFKYTTPAYENPDKNSYSYRLIGFDDNWSDWDKINFKEYTNLREGSYTFQIKTQNSFGAKSNIKSFHFSIKPPYLRSRVAYISYLFLLVLVIIGNVYYLRKRILKARLREKIKQEKRFAQREKMFKEQTALSEKEIVQLRNESLRNEMTFKNKELANATLHLIQKNKTLTYLKEDLGKLLKNIPSDSPEKQNVNNLLKKINKDLRNEKSWELFNSYFDEVHQDFIARLKSQHKDLTPKELRLCAYLRMNISTKEIAPLMNISIRGVEISRYRLRKKLKLEHDKNLTDFILTF